MLRSQTHPHILGPVFEQLVLFFFTLATFAPAVCNGTDISWGLGTIRPALRASTYILGLKNKKMELGF